MLEDEPINAKKSEPATRALLWKKVLLNISRNAQKNTSTTVSFSGILKNTFLIEYLRWLRLQFFPDQFQMHACKLKHFIESLWNVKNWIFIITV